jgi:hypothetical protein
VHVFIVGFYPINFVSAQERNAPTRLDHKAIEVLRPVFDTFQQGTYLCAPLAPALGLEPLFCMLDRVLESRLVERL